MSDKPLWVRWFPADFRGSGRVAQMSRDEEYLYRVLLDYQATEGALPSDPSRLARLAKMSPDEFASAWASLRDCFEQGADGGWRNGRMHDERERTLRVSESLREKGRAGGLAKAARQAGAKRGQYQGSSSGRPQAEPSSSTGSSSREPRAESPTPDGVGGYAPSAPPRAARQPTFAKADALAMLPPEHALELGPTWTRWIEHVWARKKPTRTAVESHLASFCEVWAKRGAKAACELLDGGIASNAQGIPGWAKERALNGATNGATHNGRPTNGRRPHKSILDHLAEGTLTLSND